MRGNYPEHPFNAYFFKFNATNSIDTFLNENDSKSLIVENSLIGFWRSEQNGSFLKIDKTGRIYYCLNKNQIKIISMGNIDDRSNLNWGKFLVFKESEIFDLNEDLKSNMNRTWTPNLDSGVLRFHGNGVQAKSSYVKVDKIDLMCD